ncbi:hypothetical protein Taro_009606 [Colocasia esculenta]|uniref:Peroxidase n=1 Tax=Colocasia esculenta TaxID=4460 RepID=A0A843U599_COLES|nr:hypothetical protein [Colocasia esculenta]
MGLKVALLVLALALCACTTSQAHLHCGFYRKTCPAAENIVRQTVKRALKKDSGLVADFIRMHFHDCFVRGCDASILLDSTAKNKAEKDSPINNPSLEGFDVIDAAKASLEKECKGVVSCADIIAFAARDSVALSGGLHYEVPAGRRDGRISRALEADDTLPPPTFNLKQLTKRFAEKGFTQEEMVTLSGAHTLGVAHCTSISDRLYNFSSKLSTDPSLDPAYAATLKNQCPKGSTDPNLTVNLDPPSPLRFDSSYYKDVLVHRGLFESDQALLSSPVTAKQVVANAVDEALFKKKFADAMVKLGQLHVLTDKNGEIRHNCRVVN